MPPSEMSKLRQWHSCCLRSRSYRNRTRTLIGTRTQRRCIGHGPLVSGFEECDIAFIPGKPF
jgi:hypothetical protein